MTGVEASSGSGGSSPSGPGPDVVDSPSGPGPDVVPPQAMAASLTAALRAAGLDGEVSPGSLRPVGGGASRDTWSLVLVGREGQRPLIAQVERPSSLQKIGLADQATLMRAAARAGVPVPAVVAVGEDLGGSGLPFLIATRVEGETIPRRIMRDPALAPARAELAEACGEALAGIHRIPPDVAPLPAEDPLRAYRTVLDTFDQPHPALELGFRWLERHRPPGSGPVVVHGDFRTGNLVVGPDGLRAVLDWELAHRGDPVEDLGWFCVRAWRFGSPWVAGGFGPVEQLLAGYQAGGGGEVDPEVLRWWQAFGTLRWGILCLVQAAKYLSGRERSIELLAIGRRVAENEHDLLELIR